MLSNSPIIGYLICGVRLWEKNGIKISEERSYNWNWTVNILLTSVNHSVVHSVSNCTMCQAGEQTVAILTHY